MKGLSIFVLLALVVVGYFVFSKSNEKKETTEENESQMEETSDMSNDTAVSQDIDGVKDFNTEESMANWTGSKTLIKEYFDHGSIKIKSGNAVFAKGVLISGEIVFDMNSISTNSTGRGDDEENLSGLAGHLKSADFFDAEKYPEAKFVVKEAVKNSETSYTLKGDLTIKDKTNPMSIEASVTNENGMVAIKGTTNVDRSLFDVRYGSTKFFSDIGDNVIGDEFTLDFKVVTK